MFAQLVHKINSANTKFYFEKYVYSVNFIIQMEPDKSPSINGL
jgi:hypothetical protein